MALILGEGTLLKEPSMGNADLTVIYITSQTENQAFEERIRQTLLETMGGLPLISVSQKPISFGENICVGEVGCSGRNGFRQLQVGARAAKTRFVCTAEADFLYPPQYFEFIPEMDDVFYVAIPTWILDVRGSSRRLFLRKPWGDAGAMIVERETLVRRIDAMLGTQEMWTTRDVVRGGNLLRRRFVKVIQFDVGVPIVTFQTVTQLHGKHPVSKRSKTSDLPYWGNADALIEKYKP